MKKNILKVILVICVFSLFITNIVLADEKNKSKGILFLEKDDISIKEDNFRINCLRENGILIGDEKGFLGLENTIKRQEMVVLISRLMGVEEQAKTWDTTSLSFEDVSKDNWAAPYIAWAKDNNITKGYSDNWFGYNDELTNIQTKIFLLRVVGFKDVTMDNANEWAYLSGLVDEQDEKDYNILRREVAIMLYNALGISYEDNINIREKIGIKEDITREEITLRMYLEKYDFELKNMSIDGDICNLIIDFKGEKITKDNLLNSIKELTNIATMSTVKNLGLISQEDNTRIKVVLFEDYGIIAKIYLNDSTIYDISDNEKIEL